MEHIERLDRNLKFKGAIVDFYQDTMKLPNGKVETWDLVHHRVGAAAVVPVLPDGRFLMIKQFRPALDRETIEIPAGARDSITEDTAICAARELREETGYTAGKLELIIKLHPTIAYCDEKIDIYLATDLKYEGNQILDEAESIDVVPMSGEELRELIYKGVIQDGKTVCALLAAMDILGKRR